MSRKNRYAELTENLTYARRVAIQCGEGDDGGTCNLDCLKLKLKGWRQTKTLQAIAAAGLSASRSIDGSYLINPPVPAQGDARTRQVEAMCKVVYREFQPSIYYQMD